MSDGGGDGTTGGGRGGTGDKGKATPLYRVRFASGDKLYELYARSVRQGELYGFVVIEDLVFGANAGIVLDPSEERLKSEFAGVSRTFVPMHAVVRIDQVEKRGPAKIVELDGKVARFPSPIYTPDRTSDS